jgi:hypothetical protein
VVPSIKSESARVSRAIGRGGIALALLVAVGGSATPSWGDGEPFFAAMEIPGKPEYVVFGAVKDDQGAYLRGANITVTVSDPALMSVATTDTMGRFRTLDVGRAIKDMGYDVDASHIDVSVTDPGYRLAHKINRGRGGQNSGAVEMDFVMERDGK